MLPTSQQQVKDISIMYEKNYGPQNRTKTIQQLTKHQNTTHHNY